MDTTRTPAPIREITKEEFNAAKPVEASLPTATDGLPNLGTGLGYLVVHRSLKPTTLAVPTLDAYQWLTRQLGGLHASTTWAIAEREDLLRKIAKLQYPISIGGIDMLDSLMDLEIANFDELMQATEFTTVVASSACGCGTHDDYEVALTKEAAARVYFANDKGLKWHSMPKQDTIGHLPYDRTFLVDPDKLNCMRIVRDTQFRGTNPSDREFNALQEEEVLVAQVTSVCYLACTAEGVRKILNSVDPAESSLTLYTGAYVPPSDPDPASADDLFDIFRDLGIHVIAIPLGHLHPES